MDEIPDGLERAGRVVKEVVVYQTTEDPTLRSSIGKALSKERDKGKRKWLIFFSPSSAGYVIPHLRGFGIITLSSENGSRDEAIVKIAAIGETTKRYLEDVGIKVDAVAEEPTPVALLRSIQRDDG